MEKLRFFSILKLSFFIIALGCYNLVPNLTNLNLGTHQDASYASYHGAQNLLLQLHEGGKTKTGNHESSHPSVFNISPSITHIESSAFYQISTAQSHHSFKFFKFSISPRAPPLA